MRTSDLHKDQRTTDLDLTEGILEVTYQPSKISRKLMREVDEAVGDDLDAEAAVAPVNEMLIRIVSAWDLEDDDGQPVPITTEGLDPLPSGFLSRVLDAIRADSRLEAEGKASGST